MRHPRTLRHCKAGRRAIRGNYNELWDLGWFLNDLPSRNRVRFIRPDGSAIANKTVRIYRSSGETIDFRQIQGYAMIFDGTPDETHTTDANGSVLLGRNPFSAGEIVALVDRANGVAIVEILDDGTRRWAVNLPNFRKNHRAGIEEHATGSESPQLDSRLLFAGDNPARSRPGKRCDPWRNLIPPFR